MLDTYGLTLNTGPIAEPVTLEEMRLHLRVTDGNEIAIDAGAAVDKGGGKVGIPATANGLSTSGGDRIIISGTDNFDGRYSTDGDTATDEVVVTATYVAETFSGVDENIHNSGAEDDMIYNLITAARRICEQWQNRAYLTQTWNMYLDRFPPVINPPYAPLQTATIKYYDSNGVQQELSDTLYSVYIKQEPGRIIPVFGQVWPAVRSIPNTVEVVYVAGYGATRASTPESVKGAIKFLVAHWFENREEVILQGTPKRLPLAVEALLQIDRVFG